MNDIHIYLFPFQKLQIKLHFFHTASNLFWKPYKGWYFKKDFNLDAAAISIGYKAFHFDSFVCNWGMIDECASISLKQAQIWPEGQTSGELSRDIAYVSFPSLISILKRKRNAKRRMKICREKLEGLGALFG